MKKKIAILSVVCALILAAVWFAYQNRTPQVEYMTETVKITDIQTTVLAGGVVNALELVDVGAQATGQVDKLYVELGQHVKKGELIAEINAAGQLTALQEEEIAHKNLQTQHKIREAQLKLAQDEHKSQKLLYDNDLLPKMEYLKSQNALNVAMHELESTKLQLVQAKLKITTAKNNLSHARITAPMDGVVAAIVTKQGQTVNAAQSAPTIIRLAQIDTVLIKAKFSEVDVPALKTGMPAKFTILGMPDRQFEATLDALELLPIGTQSDSTSQSAVYYTGLLTVPNPDHELFVGMTASIEIITHAKQNVASVPITALGDPLDDDTYKVLVMTNDESTPTERTIKIGLKNETLAEVISGLDVGEQVVVSQSEGGVQALSEAEMGM